MNFMVFLLVNNCCPILLVVWLSPDFDNARKLLFLKLGQAPGQITSFRFHLQKFSVAANFILRQHRILPAMLLHPTFGGTSWLRPARKALPSLSVRGLRTAQRGIWSSHNTSEAWAWSLGTFDYLAHMSARSRQIESMIAR